MLFLARSLITVQCELSCVWQHNLLMCNMSCFWQRLLCYCALGAISGSVSYYEMSGSVIYYYAILFRVVPFIPVQYGLFLGKFKAGWGGLEIKHVVVLLTTSNRYLLE